MNASSTDIQLEHMKPCVIPDAQFIPFKPGITYLKNPHRGAYLKLRKEDADYMPAHGGTL
ncbi:MAG: hypothetical protein GF401_17710 [Chitinivibrionales bacterium]|nr:hypothetical protein [Chitinivibrionales bacterium]